MSEAFPTLRRRLFYVRATRWELYARFWLVSVDIEWPSRPRAWSDSGHRAVSFDLPHVLLTLWDRGCAPFKSEGHKR